MPDIGLMRPVIADFQRRVSEPVRRRTDVIDIFK